jgi:hypothetical protein
MKFELDRYEADGNGDRCELPLVVMSDAESDGAFVRLAIASMDFLVDVDELLTAVAVASGRPITTTTPNKAVQP